jgi:hypothetical protein
MKTIIVTKSSLQTMLDDENPIKVQHVIGRALVVLFNRQTESEKNVNNTTEHNSIGFTGVDGKSGTITAKYYLKHKSLLPWQVDKWLKRGKDGYSRLTKYHSQLNEAAVEKAKKLSI